MAKDEQGNIIPYYPGEVRWSDGSITSDLPAENLAHMFNVNQFVVSQLNPHVLPFVFPRVLDASTTFGILYRIYDYFNREFYHVSSCVS
jgi:predicted acylesterase/phospholipase RssA